VRPDVAQNEVVQERPQSAEPMIERAAAELPAAAVAAPLKLEWPSDLVQIETDPHKVQAVAIEEPAPVRTPRRIRPAPPPVSNEPLVQVETDTRESAPIEP
jgi:hypothetical protein